MATVLEELLIKVGVEVDADGIKNAGKRTKDALDKDIKADERRGKTTKTNNKAKKDADGQERKREEKASKSQDKEAKRQKLINKELNTAKGLLGGLASGWVVAGVAVASFAKKRMTAESGQVKLSRSIDVGFEKMQQLKSAAAKEDVPGQAVESTLSSLAGVIGATNDGLQNMGLALLGISAWGDDGSLKNSIELLLEVAEAIKGLPKQVQLQRLGQVGISQAMLPFMQQARFSIEREMDIAKIKGVAIRENAGIAEDASTKWSRAGDTFMAGWAAQSKNVHAASGAIAEFSDSILKVANTRVSDIPSSIYRQFSNIKNEILGAESDGGGRSFLMNTPRGKIQKAQSAGIGEINLTVNASGLSAQEAERAATNAISSAIRTSVNNNEQQGDL